MAKLPTTGACTSNLGETHLFSRHSSLRQIGRYIHRFRAGACCMEWLRRVCSRRARSEMFTARCRIESGTGFWLIALSQNDSNDILFSGLSVLFHRERVWQRLSTRRSRSKNSYVLGLIHNRARNPIQYSSDLLERKKCSQGFKRWQLSSKARLKNPIRLNTFAAFSE